MGKFALCYDVTIRHYMVRIYNRPNEITQLLLLIFHKCDLIKYLLTPSHASPSPVAGMGMKLLLLEPLA